MIDKRMYRIIEGIGVYFEPQWVLQKRYFRKSYGKKVPAWRTVYTSKSFDACEAELERLKRTKVENLT